MNAEELRRRLREATHEMYQLGLTFPDPMIPPVAENCTPIAAGPLRFDVEVRHLTDAAVDEALGRASVGEDLFDDFGGSVHVFGAADGLEHLRFDCFDEAPHYHYVHHQRGGSTVCRIDQFAEGDPVAWTLGRLRHRLPDMLRHAGAADLAGQVEDRGDEVLAAVDDVETVLRAASQRAHELWATA